MNGSEDFDVQKEASELRDRFSVKLDVKKVSQKNFTGQEVLLVVIGFTFSQIASGFLRDVGSDAWSLIKRICVIIYNKFKSKSQSTIVKLEAVLQPGSCHVILTYRADEKSEINNIDQFIDSARMKIAELQKELSSCPVEGSTSEAKMYEFIDSKWTERR